MVDYNIPYNNFGYSSRSVPTTNPYSQTQIPTYQSAPQPQNDNSIIWVQGEAGAKSFAVAPGKSVMLMDSEQSRFYIKTADTSGMPMPLRIFEYSEVTTTPQTNAPIQTEQTDIYVTREEFDGRLQAILDRIDSMTAKRNNGQKKEK